MSTLESIRAAVAQATRVVKPPPPSRNYTGVVVSAGKMSKTVKVRIMKQDWNHHVRKYFDRPVHYLTHDPASSLREGDIIRLASGNRFSKNVRHVVTQIIAPFGPPLSERPPLPSLDDIQARKDEKKAAKTERKSARITEEIRRKKEEKRLQREKRRSKEAGKTGEAKVADSEESKPYAKGVRSDMVIEGSGGLHHPGKIHDRAMANSQKAIRLKEKAQENEEELKRTDDRLEQMRVSGEETGKTGTEELKQEDEKTDSRGGGWFGWR
ncbi:MAG: hypothetical protein Q9165_006400 [Trypethelium subeluteriae]